MEQNEIHFYPALPIELHVTMEGDTVGLEPTTRGFADQCNIAVCTSNLKCTNASPRRELNPCPNLGKVVCYHYNTRT